MKPERYISKHSLAGRFYKLLRGEKASAPENTLVQKTYEGTDDHFFEEATDTLKAQVKQAIDPQQPKGTPTKVLEKKNKKQASPKLFPNDFSKALHQDFNQRWKVRDTTTYSANPYSDLYRDFLKAQLTIRNASPDAKEVVLWGNSSVFNTTAPLPTEVQFHTITAQLSAPTGIHPQGLCYNPANQLLYVANQLSGTISVFNAANALVHTIVLEPSIPGLSSPVAIAVNTNMASTHYGLVHVACSVSNVVAVIDLAFNVIATIDVGTRPIDIAFNPVNKCLYIPNLVDDTVSVLDAETLTPVAGSPFAAGNDPLAVGINPENGEVYIANSLGNSITVLDATNVLLTTLALPGQYPSSVTYNPANHSMYAITASSNGIHQVNLATHHVDLSLATGPKPYHSFFNPDNNYLYVQNRQDNSFTIIRLDNSIISGLSFGAQNVGGCFNPANHSIYVSDTSHDRINVIGYLGTASFLTMVGNYSELKEEFKANPAVLQHVKFVITGAQRIYSFRKSRFTAFGSVKSRPLSFERYASPQHSMNVAEVTDLANTLIDRKMNWRFMLPGLHTVTILFWYRQFELREFLQTPPYKTLKTLKR